MDDTPQILDVSYGNFSCRLEGFDDSVETMKAVVSYFHELAGHNRFMDMAPQAPDAETLARLTEDQAGVAVDVEADGNKVSLRPTAAVDVIVDDMVDDVEDTLGDEPVDDTVAPAEDEAITEDVVAEEEAEAEAEAEDLADDEADVDDIAEVEATEEDDTEDALADLAADEDEVAASEDEDEVVASEMDEGDDPTPMDDVAAQDDADEDDADLADDSVAAKLQRIRAVVTKDDVAETAETAEEAYAEDTTAPEEPAISGNPLAQRLADLAKRNAERAAQEAGVELDIDDDDDAISAEDLAELEAEFAEEDTAKEPTETKEKTAILELAPEDRASDDDLAGFAKAMREDDIDNTDEDSGPLVLTPDAEIALDADDDDFDLKKEVAEAQRSIEALGKGKGSDVLNNVNMNTTRILSQADEHLNEPEGRRHRDAFAQLKAAVAATEAARQLGDPGASKRDKDEAFREDLGAHAAEEEIERNSRPLDSFVDHSAKTDDDDASSASEDAAERDDVSPSTAKTEETPAPAPLKLVSSKFAEPAGKQVDVASARLREIASQKTTGGSSKGGFAEFASQKGATELADLLEAAAAYIAFVEGDDDFSRPQVMKKVQTATNNDFSREDGLRSFGRLLRQSRIIKLSNGRFQVSEDTRFRPEDKAAQG